MWKRALADSVKDELNRLKNGSEKEQQRYDNANEAITAVLINPLDPDYIKSNVDHYRAANILGQFRIFFEIINEHKTVHFVWMNNEDHIHDTSKGINDPCYKQFKHLNDHSKLQRFAPPKAVKAQLNITGTWKTSSSIYVKYSDASGNVNSTLTLIAHTDNSSYNMLDIKADMEDVGLEEALLKKVLTSAKSVGVKIIFTLDLTRNQDYISFYKKLLSSTGFIVTAADADQEVWEI